MWISLFYPTWDLLGFLNRRVNTFDQFWKSICHYLYFLSAIIYRKSDEIYNKLFQLILCHILQGGTYHINIYSYSQICVWLWWFHSMLKVKFRSDPHGCHPRTQAEEAAITWVCFQAYARPRQTTEAHLTSANIMSTLIPLAKGGHMTKPKDWDRSLLHSWRGLAKDDYMLNNNAFDHSPLPHKYSL